MRVLHQRGDEGSHRVGLLDDDGEPIAVVSGFLLFLAARDCSPNTLVSYAYDLRHLWRFFDRDGLAWEEFAPRHSIALLEYLPIFSRDVLRRIAANDDSWETMVPEQVAELIKRRGFFSYIRPGARD